MASRGLTVGSLRALIRDLPDDTVVLVPGHDRSYERATANILDAQRQGANEYAEVDPGGGPRVVQALVIT